METVINVATDAAAETAAQTLGAETVTVIKTGLFSSLGNLIKESPIGTAVAVTVVVGGIAYMGYRKYCGTKAEVTEVEMTVEQYAQFLFACAAQAEKGEPTGLNKVKVKIVKVKPEEAPKADTEA